jgi:hypothetical protein
MKQNRATRNARRLVGVLVIVGSVVLAGCTGSASWTPARGARWQWILDGNAEACRNVNVAVCDIDWRSGEDETRPVSDPVNVAAVQARRRLIRDLQGRGTKVVCYIEAGDWNRERRDYRALPTSALGNTIDGWLSERWVNVSSSHRPQVLQVMQARVNECAADGFDAMEFDMVEAIDDRSRGFALTDAEQITFNRALAAMAHRAGKAAVHKGIPRLAPHLVNDFDFALVEECNLQDCTPLNAYTRAGKAVLVAEYNGGTNGTPYRDARRCNVAAANGWSLIQKNVNLDPQVAFC